MDDLYITEIIILSSFYDEGLEEKEVSSDQVYEIFLDGLYDAYGDFESSKFENKVAVLQFITFMALSMKEMNARVSESLERRCQKNMLSLTFNLLERRKREMKLPDNIEDFFVKPWVDDLSDTRAATLSVNAVDSYYLFHRNENLAGQKRMQEDPEENRLTKRLGDAERLPVSTKEYTPSDLHAKEMKIAQLKLELAQAENEKLRRLLAQAEIALLKRALSEKERQLDSNFEHATPIVLQGMMLALEGLELSLKNVTASINNFKAAFAKLQDADH